VTEYLLSEQAMVPLLQRLVRYPSVQTELQEEDPGVKAFITDCVAPEIAALGLGSGRYDGMGNLIVELGPADADRSILFATYAMTHQAGRMTDPFAATIIDTDAGPAVRGRGVAEQKTAMTAALTAIADAHREGPAGRIILTVLSAGETGRHTAIESVCGALDDVPDVAIICLGTDSRIGAANKGRIDVDISVSGKSAHSSTPSAGIDAIEGARQCLNALHGLDLGVADSPVFGAATLTPTAIRSGPTATHTVQDMAELTFDRRLLPGEDPDAAFAFIRDALPKDGPWEVDCRRGPFMYPNEVADDGPLMTLLRGAYADAGLGEAEKVICNFALDAGYFGHRGIEAVMLGPGEIDQFHSEEEHVQVSDMLSMAWVYYALIERAFA
jgi:acetylornithine deacetylase/succinyl-diaminopimelate desuccinylase-like protein